MKHLLFLVLLANWNFIYSQESETSKDTLNKPEKLISTILIDSAKLHKYREINASGAILYENPSVTFDNNSYLSATSLTRIRDNSPAILTLNGVPLSQTILPINQFNIGKIEISKTSFCTGTNFLNGSVNLSTIKPHFNTPLKVSYEGGLNIGRYTPTTMSLNEGVSLSNNVSIEKGKEKSATRISFSNSTSGLGNHEGDYLLLLNTINFDKTNLASPNILINTSISLTQGTYLTNYIPYDYEGIEISYENKRLYSHMVFGNVAVNYKVTDLLHLNINTGTMFSKLGIGYSDDPMLSNSFYSDPKNCTPFYADFSATRKTKLNSKNVLVTSLGYNFLSYQSNQASPFSSYKTRSLYGAINYSYSNVINIKGSLCNELYGDVYPNLDYFLVSAVEFQLDVYKLLIKKLTSSSIMLYASYNTSQKQSNFINLTNKFEGGLDISILSNRLGLNICYFKYDSRINYGAIYQDQWGGGHLSIPIYGRFDKGVEIQNSIKIIETKSTNWLIKNNFAWYNSNAKPYDWHQEYLSLLKSHLPKYKLGFVSDFTLKNLSFGFIIEQLKDQPTNIFPLEFSDPGKKVTDILAIRQINLMYTKNNLNLKRIKSYSISLFAKNFNLSAKPGEYKNIRPVYFEQAYGVSCSRMIGINLQMTF